MEEGNSSSALTQQENFNGGQTSIHWLVIVYLFPAWLD
jgi:hypothetical protein